MIRFFRTERFLMWNVVHRFAAPQTEIRALVEGQMLHHKAVAGDMGFSFGENTRILATGGASANRTILQVMADVFNAPVYIQKTTEAALLGAAFRAKYALFYDEQRAHTAELEVETYCEHIGRLRPHHMQRICDPSPDCEQLYGPMLERYREMVRVLTTTTTTTTKL